MGYRLRTLLIALALLPPLLAGVWLAGSEVVHFYCYVRAQQNWQEVGEAGSIPGFRANLHSGSNEQD